MSSRPKTNRFAKYLSWIPGFNMANAENDGGIWEPTATISHRYANPTLLRSILKDIGFKDADIKIRKTESNGYDIKLSRKPSDREMNKIYDVLEESEGKT